MIDRKTEVRIYCRAVVEYPFADDVNCNEMAHPEMIAEYHERIRGVLDRRLTLFADSVRVVGTVRGTRGEGTVPLSGLHASPHKSWLRSKHYHWAVASLCILSPFLFLPFVVMPPNFVLLSIGVVLYVPAIWYFLIARKRKEVAIFLNRSGVVGLDLWYVDQMRCAFLNSLPQSQSKSANKAVNRRCPSRGFEMDSQSREHGLPQLFAAKVRPTQ